MPAPSNASDDPSPHQKDEQLPVHANVRRTPDHPLPRFPLQNRHEFLASIPSDDVHLANRVLQQRTDLLQHRIARVR